MRLADVHAVDPSHARSVPKIRVDCAAAPKVLECLHVRERARAMVTALRVSSSYILYGLRAGRSRVYF